MSSVNPTTWSIDYLLFPAGRIPPDTDLSRLRRQRLAVGGVAVLLFAVAQFWLHLVTIFVPEPYLDEVFHIPQAQRYCKGDFSWDDKITTPPGLYAISSLGIRWVAGTACTVKSLRLTNAFGLLGILFAVIACRSHLDSSASQGSIKSNEEEKIWVSTYSVHSAVNICLFPPLFFFSGLYYTDVLSTFFVLAAYSSFLSRRGENPSSLSNLQAVVWGILALLMRQTNIFWVAVFMAGLEWVRGCNAAAKKLDPSTKDKYWLQAFVVSSMSGVMFDPMLGSATIMEFAWCLLSIALSAARNPLLLLQRLRPYLALLVLFGGFVVWNGGVVLGDKSNHVATIHLPQLLYIWPFMAFFSLPLIIPYAMSILRHLLSVTAYNASARLQSRLSLESARCLVCLLISLGTALIIVHFNTIIHPFTLADNRHYVFYVFRYTIRRHRYMKYVLVPIYVMSCLLVHRCLAGFANTVHETNKQTLKQRPSGPRTSKHPANIVEGYQWVWLRPARYISNPNQTSLFLIWLLSTTLSLVTAPLVEPRYFIIPWIIWRIHIPTFTSSSSEVRTTDGESTPPRIMDAPSLSAVYDYRLWLETVWFLAINMITGYIFLFRTFDWPSEPGRVQRFMW